MLKKSLTITGCKYLLLALSTLLATNANMVLAQSEIKENEVILAQNLDDSTLDTEPNIVAPISQTETLLSLQGGERLMMEAEQAINQGNYAVAETKLQQARRIFNQLSNFYLQLADSFSGIDSRITADQRSGALRTAALRDESTYQLALVHRAQNKPELSVPLLIQIIRSQNPTSELGRKSYQQLYEIGFVQVPFERSSSR
jgi:hypothetical protein